MNGRMDLEQRLDQFLADRGDRLPDRVIDAAMTEIADTDQRRTWRAPWRTSPMLKYAGLAAAAALVVVGGAIISTVGGPEPPPSVAPVPTATLAPSSTPTPSLVPVPTPFLGSTLPAAGTVLDDLALPAGNTEWMAAGHGDIWIPGGEPGTLTRIDTTSTDSRTIDLGALNQTVAADDDGVWATLNFANEIVKIDEATNEIVDRIATPGYDIYAIALDGDRLWATVYSSDDPSTEGVLVIDTASGEIIHRVEMGEYGTTGIAIGGGSAWVAQNAIGRLAQIDLETFEELSSTSVGRSPLIVAYGFGSAWVAPRQTNSVFRVDAEGDAVEILMPVGAEETYTKRSANSVAIGPDGVWATAGVFEGCESMPDQDFLVRIDPATDTVAAGVPMTCAYGVVVDEAGDVWATGGPRLFRVRPGT